MFNPFGCRHNNVAWPQGGFQKCNDCAARRRYWRIGRKPGPWTKELTILQADERAAELKTAGGWMGENSK